MFKVDPYFINGQHRITVVLVGAGGNGSLILTKLARLSRALNHLDHPGFFVHVIDYDKVEQHNVGRQMFTDADIGDYKSRALVSKINMAFGFDWTCSTEPFSQSQNGNIIISAVDNVLTRKEVHDGFYNHEPEYGDIRRKYYWIDCGNARDYGQVVISDLEGKMRNIFDIFGTDLEKQDTVEQQGEGCNYYDRLMEQDLFINDWVSLYTITILKDLLFQKYLDYQGFVFNTSNYDIRKIPIIKSK